MSLEMYPQRSSEPETYSEIVTMLGTGASAPTKTYGKGLAITRSGVGVYVLTFTDPPGNLAGYSTGFKATTMSALKGYTATLGDFDAAGKVISVSVWTSAFAAADLAAAQSLSLLLVFKRAGSTV